MDEEKKEQEKLEKQAKKDQEKLEKQARKDLEKQEKKARKEKSGKENGCIEECRWRYGWRMANGNGVGSKQ